MEFASASRIQRLIPFQKPKRAIESIENEFYRREKKKPKKHVHRRNSQIKNKIFFVKICTHEKVLRLLII